MLLKSVGVLLALVVCANLPSPAHGQAANCQISFLTRFRQCLADRSLNSDHFLWLTRNGSMGTQPPDLPGFTEAACRQEEQLGGCFKTLVGQFENMTTGCSDSDKNAIKKFYRNVIMIFDKKCAHPCRDQLVPSLAECFTSANVSASLFLSNVTLTRGQMLGQTSTEVDTFCQKREDILECMRMKTAACPETPDILSAIGLDVEAMNHTVTLLCDNRQLYFHGVRCSANRSTAEETCLQTLMQGLSYLETQFETRNIDRDVFAVDMCRLRLDHIRCDLNAITMRDNDTKCPDEVVGLRREQECAMIPADCRENFEDRVIDSCDPTRFLKEKRTAFIATHSKQTSGGAAKAGVTYGLVTAMAAAASFWAFYVSLEMREKFL